MTKKLYLELFLYSMALPTIVFVACMISKTFGFIVWSSLILALIVTVRKFMKEMK